MSRSRLPRQIASLAKSAPLALALAAMGCSSTGGTESAAAPRSANLEVAASAPSAALALHGVAAAPDESTRQAKGQPAPSTFPHDDLRTALRAASPGIRACRGEQGPREIDARLRFAPSGKVTDVDLGPAVGTVASCVEGKLASIALTPFDGAPVDVKLRVHL